MNKFLYKIVFYIFVFFLLIKNIYYININKFVNVIYFFITYIFCCFLFDNILVKLSLCIIIPDVLYTKNYLYNIETLEDLSKLGEDIINKVEDNMDEYNEKQEDELNEQSKAEKEEDVHKKGFAKSNKPTSDEEQMDNLNKSINP